MRFGNEKNKSEFITYLIKEYSPYFEKDNFWPKDSVFIKHFNDNDIKTLLILYSDEVLNTSNTADKNYFKAFTNSYIHSFMIATPKEKDSVA